MSVVVEVFLIHVSFSTLQDAAGIYTARIRPFEKDCMCLCSLMTRVRLGLGGLHPVAVFPALLSSDGRAVKGEMSAKSKGRRPPRALNVPVQRVGRRLSIYQWTPPTRAHV